MFDIYAPLWSRSATPADRRLPDANGRTEADALVKYSLLSIGMAPMWSEPPCVSHADVAAPAFMSRSMIASR
jgi:hypothetical protein